jgi:NAD(P)-dependent dehydrogenase (short-subunit alcohol dehydrogenase family)
MKTVVITGISRGIGKALAETFLNNGDFVIGTSTSATCDLLHKNLIILQLDLSKSDSIVECTESIVKTKRNVDVLINNAGGWFEEEYEPKTDIEKLRKTLEVNLIGVIDFTEKIVPIINSSGHIINISSRAGSLQYIRHTKHPAYKISKVALNMFTRILAIRLKDKVTVSAVHPGWVKTDMGGPDGDITPTEAAGDIFNLLAKPDLETGQFWFKDEKFPW